MRHHSRYVLSAGGCLQFLVHVLCRGTEPLRLCMGLTQNLPQTDFLLTGGFELLLRLFDPRLHSFHAEIVSLSVIISYPCEGEKVITHTIELFPCHLCLQSLGPASELHQQLTIVVGAPSCPIETPDGGLQLSYRSAVSLVSQLPTEEHPLAHLVHPLVITACIQS